MRNLVRAAVVAALFTPLALTAPSTAHAATCTTYIAGNPITTPCPGYQDQPNATATPVWVSTDYGPTFDLAYWNFAKVREGGRLFFANLGSPENGVAERLHGAGFDSGVVQRGQAVEVQGVSTLAPGYYPIYNINGDHAGDLFIVRCGSECIL